MSNNKNIIFFNSDTEIESFKNENDFLKTECLIKGRELKSLTKQYSEDASEKEEMLRQIKSDVDTVSYDVIKSNEMLAAEQSLRLVISYSGFATHNV